MSSYEKPPIDKPKTNGKVIPLYEGMKTHIHSDTINEVKREAVIFCTTGAAIGFMVCKKLNVNPVFGIIIGPALFYYGLYALHNSANKRLSKK